MPKILLLVPEIDEPTNDWLVLKILNEWTNEAIN